MVRILETLREIGAGQTLLVHHVRRPIHLYPRLDALGCTHETREQPDGWQGYGRRIDRELLDEIAWPPSEHPLVYVCGPTAFAETAASILVALGHEPDRIRTERFGPTGG